jgi:hypothetical protein
MPERWLAEIQKIGRMEPIGDDLMERAERGPFLAEPGARPASRLTAALLAVQIMVAGGWTAYAALSGTGGQQPLGDGATDFEALWPETSFAEAHQVQALVDAGDATVQWRVDPSGVALHYGREVLGWPIPLARETVTNDPDTIVVSLHGLNASCEGYECSAPLSRPIVTLTLQRLVRSGDGGIWSVTAVDGEEPTSAGS